MEYHRLEVLGGDNMARAKVHDPRTAVDKWNGRAFIIARLVTDVFQNTCAYGFNFLVFLVSPIFLFFCCMFFIYFCFFYKGICVFHLLLSIFDLILNLASVHGLVESFYPSVSF